MRRGFNPVIIFNKRGEIFAFATGSDATSEHEWGSKSMQEDLCNPEGAAPKSVGLLEKVTQACGITDPAPRTDPELIAALRAGKAFAYPQLLDRKALSKNLDRLQFITGVEKGQPVAVFGYAPRRERVAVDNRELMFYRDEEYVGAWDEGSFAFKVRGEKLVAKLKQFAEKAQAGGALFAGTFLKVHEKEHLSGVILALRDDLRTEHLQAAAKAQADWEATLRLKAKSRLEELYELYREHRKTVRSAVLPGNLGEVWTDGPDSDVAYRLNPDRDSWGEYYGPYTFEQLRDWILAEEKYRLVPTLKKNSAPA